VNGCQYRRRESLASNDDRVTRIFRDHVDDFCRVPLLGCIVQLFKVLPLRSVWLICYEYNSCFPEPWFILFIAAHQAVSSRPRVGLVRVGQMSHTRHRQPCGSQRILADESLAGSTWRMTTVVSESMLPRHCTIPQPVPFCTTVHSPTRSLVCQPFLS
jgi:hypothetical protein